jgi:hypothetical protein
MLYTQMSKVSALQRNQNSKKTNLLPIKHNDNYISIRTLKYVNYTERPTTHQQILTVLKIRLNYN